MIRRIIAIVLIVLGLGTVGAAIASATVWKPDSTVTVPLPAEPEVNYVISDPGVLNIVNPTVKVHAVAQNPESPVFLAMGRTDDVEAWVAESDHGRIVGLETWEALSYQTVHGVEPEVEEGEEPEAQEEEPEPANPADSDMWVEEVNGVGELSYTWQETPGRWSMIVATDGSGPAPMVELTWEREVPTPALIPGVILGSVLTLAGIFLLITALRARTRRIGVDEDRLDDEQVTGAEEESPDEASVVAAADDTDEREATPEEIMAGVEAAASAPEPVVDTGGFEYALSAPSATVNAYPHDLSEEGTGESEPEQGEEPRPLTRREIRERERERERALALGTTDVGEVGEHWPTQETPRAVAVEPEPEPAPRRRWWQRRAAPQPAAPAGPIVIDDDTGEIIITGEIDVSNLTPQASADSWRATWGLDKDTRTRWIPVMRDPEGDEGDDDE